MPRNVKKRKEKRVIKKRITYPLINIETEQGNEWRGIDIFLNYYYSRSDGAQDVRPRRSEWQDGKV